MQKFKSQRDFDDELGAVEFECRRLPISTVYGHWSQMVFFGLFSGVFGSIFLLGGIFTFVEPPAEPRDRILLITLLAVPLSIGLFFLGIWYNKFRWEKLHLALHRKGLRWNHIAVRYDEINRIEPGAAPGTAATAMPTLSRLFGFLGAITHPVAHYHIQQGNRATVSVSLDSGSYARLRNIRGMFVANDIDRWLQILSERNPDWFRAEDWGSFRSEPAASQPSFSHPHAHTGN